MSLSYITSLGHNPPPLNGLPRKEGRKPDTVCNAHKHYENLIENHLRGSFGLSDLLTIQPKNHSISLPISLTVVTISHLKVYAHVTKANEMYLTVVAYMMIITNVLLHFIS